MYQSGSPGVARYVLAFGLLWITTLVLVGDSGVRL